MGDAGACATFGEGAPYRMLAEMSSDGILVAVEGHFTFANPAALRMLGATDPASVLGASPFDFIVPGQHAAVRERVGRLLAGEPIAPRMRQQWRRLDGEVIDAEVVGARIQWEGSTAVQVLVRDVTERVRAEALERAGRELFGALVDALPVGIGTMDATGRILWMNPAGLQIHCFASLEEMRTMLSQRIDSIGFTFPDGRPMPRAEWPDQRALRGEEVTDFEVCVRREGAPERFISFTIRRLRESQRDVGDFVIMSRDITERLRMQRALEDREAHAARQLAELDAIYRSAPIGLCVLDRDLRFVRINERLAEINGVSAANHLGRTVREIVPDIAADAEALIRLVIESGEPLLDIEMSGETAARPGVMRHWRESFHPIKDHAGHVVALNVVAEEVTEAKQQAEALRTMDQRKDEFIATLAHELRNPLAPLRTAAHLLKSPDLSDRHRSEARAMIERQVATMTRLVDDLLDVSRVTLGRIELKREPVSIGVAMQQAIEAATPALFSRQHELKVDLGDQPLWVDADLTRLAQVFTNLLTNAAKYTPAGGRVWVHARREGAEVAICVRDSGIGIPAGMLERVFEMFAQVPRGSSMAQGGLGIGLGLARRLVQMHGGTICAASAGEGRGSEFTVRLPAGESPEPGSSKPRASPAAAPTPRRVLVVDDNFDAASSLAMYLRMQGHEADAVHSGAAALQAAAAGRYDVALLDIGMPDMDGHDTARELRRRLGKACPTLVAVTGWGQRDDRRRSADAGFEHHLTKPADPDAIAAILAQTTQHDLFEPTLPHHPLTPM